MLVARRAQWIGAMAEPGVMLAVPLTESEIRPRLGEDLWVAATNSPQATVIGGREEAIGRLEQELRQARSGNAASGVGSGVAHTTPRAGQAASDAVSSRHTPRAAPDPHGDQRDGDMAVCNGVAGCEPLV